MNRKKRERIQYEKSSEISIQVARRLLQLKYHGESRYPSYHIPPSISQKLEFKRLMLSSIINMINDVPQEIRGHCKFSKPSKITEIVFSRDIFFILNDSGLGAAYCRYNNNLLCVLNRSPSEIIRSLFYNKLNDTLVIAYHHDPTTLNCAIINIRDIKEKKSLINSDCEDFQQVKVGSPGFIEFDDGNERIVVADPHNDDFIFWDMRNYKKLYEISKQEFLEMRISDGTVVFFRQPTHSTIEAHLCGIMDGRHLGKTIIKLRSSLDIQFLELHREYLLIKQENSSIRVWDLLSHICRKVPKTRDFHPKAFIFYDQVVDSTTSTYFLTVSCDEIDVWLCSNSGYIEKKFSISLPGIKTADCVNVCYKKGIIMAYSSGLFLEDTDGMNEYEHDEYTERTICRTPQFIQASKYFEYINKKVIKPPELNVGEWPNEIPNMNSPSGIYSLLSPELNDGLSAPIYPELNSLSSANSLRKAIYIHSLIDGHRIGLVYCDICDQSEDIVILHYDSDGMEIACGTNNGLFRRYKHNFKEGFIHGDLTIENKEIHNHLAN
ncbi:uncharacterized protein CMU_015210 [Cryptosporidium muris RN66]|uniref:Uncharacterized protein n=1 Tax=Cryptosporidium muris (strain RN66) TaxID=441375 RepID=B6AF77_CRYMR|nr:uncharacterized protein CMU_015210 [Cryptosporidium muris RN66]EEA06844.1 hypothetical protein, conserved [Cryptosporidium muris RN66]|eukprot:XP_002141193.1 hypothetical protein [Cryptosporidium muris RN66]